MSTRPESHAERVERFRILYDAAYPRVLSFARRRARSTEDAFDAVSETFAAVWRRLDDLPDEPARIAWIYGVARRVLANQYRSADRRTRLTDRLAAEPVSGADSEYDLVHEALATLRPDDREILTLSAWDDLDNDEIAVVLETTPGNVAVRLHRARKRLAAALESARGRAAKTMKSGVATRTPGRVNDTPAEPGEVDPT
jgi:RNA polymerase sigma factor (sigma-70 family)